MDHEASDSSDDHKTVGVDIAPDGDVLFIIGPQKHQIRVYSLILKNGSKPFSNLLGPQFSEGQALRRQLDHNSSEPMHLLLPEDNFEAMVTIFSVLHGRSREDTKNLSPKEILAVAVAADKWACTTPLSWAAKDWLKCEGIKDTAELWRLTLAAYLLDDEEGFADVTRALILHHNGSEFLLNVHEEFSCMDDGVFLLFRTLLKERKANLCLELVTRLMALAGPKKSCLCIMQNSHVDGLLKSLHLTLDFGAKSAWENMQAVLSMKFGESLEVNSRIYACNAEQRPNARYGPHDPFFQNARQQIVRELKEGPGLGLSLKVSRCGGRYKGMA